MKTLKRDRFPEVEMTSAVIMAVQGLNMWSTSTTLTSNVDKTGAVEVYTEHGEWQRATLLEDLGSMCLVRYPWGIASWVCSFCVEPVAS